MSWLVSGVATPAPGFIVDPEAPAVRTRIPRLAAALGPDCG